MDSQNIENLSRKETTKEYSRLAFLSGFFSNALYFQFRINDANCLNDLQAAVMLPEQPAT